MLTGDHIRYLAGVVAEVRSGPGAILAQRNGEHDHVHLLVKYRPKVSAAALVYSLKGVSARMPRQRYRLRTHRDHLWSPSYFGPSCGGAPLSIIRHYAEHQRTPGG